MTPKERAMQVSEFAPPGLLIHEIERAIVAAVEASAKIAEDQATERWHQAATAERNGYKDEAHGYRQMATQATQIAEMIRAQSK